MNSILPSASNLSFQQIFIESSTVRLKKWKKKKFTAILNSIQLNWHLLNEIKQKFFLPFHKTFIIISGYFKFDSILLSIFNSNIVTEWKKKIETIYNITDWKLIHKREERLNINFLINITQIFQHSFPVYSFAMFI